MTLRTLCLLSGALLVSGCLWPVRQATDQSVATLASRPLDPAPDMGPYEAAPSGKPEPGKPGAKALGDQKDSAASRGSDIQTTAFLQAAEPVPAKVKFDLTIPTEIPGSEVRLIKIEKDWTEAQRQAYIQTLYPDLPPLTEEPVPLPGPHGLPYTLADMQRIAEENSPALRQAAAAVEAAKGAIIQAGAYPNPNVGLTQQPSNDNSGATIYGFNFDQTIKTGGKLALAVAAAKKGLDNAELALRRARSNLVTQVRTAYFGVLVAKETVRVNKALARLTDVIYNHQVKLLYATQSAPYEPATLRGQAYMVRLAYVQAIATYAYSWKQLVSAVGLCQLPLSEVAGRIDRFLPAYDYDTFLCEALKRHTDMLTAYNGVDIAKYNLKAAQVTPIPDVDFNFGVAKELAVFPHAIGYSGTVTVPIPIWDQNRGNIIQAQAALAQALEQPHLTEVTITGGVAAAFTAYKTNLDALEYYRRYILPDQVQAYYGVFKRREIDINSAFADLVTAQQTLASGVSTYLATLSSLWTSVVSLADYLQTEDLFQTGKTLELPPLPDFSHMPAWPCDHGKANPEALSMHPLACGHPGMPGSGPTVQSPIHVPDPAPAPGKPSATTEEKLPAPKRAAPVEKPTAAPSDPRSPALLPLGYRDFNTGPNLLLEPPPPVVRTSFQPGQAPAAPLPLIKEP